MLQRRNLIKMLALFILLAACCPDKDGSQNSAMDTGQHVISGDHHFVEGYAPDFDHGDVNAVIEIPAGSTAKWEVDKTDGKLKWELVNDTPRIIRYLGYPANYGMIPGTLLPRTLGGDGDPLDVLVLGPQVSRGSVIRCRLIGVLYLLDRGEQDDKLIAVSYDSPFVKAKDISDLDRDFHGVTEIIRLWFTNYKGPGMLESAGYGDTTEAYRILSEAIAAWQLR